MKPFNVAVRIYDHKVDVERPGGKLMDLFNDWETKRDIRNEEAIHDIKVVPVGVAPVQHFDVFLQVQEIC